MKQLNKYSCPLSRGLGNGQPRRAKALSSAAEMRKRKRNFHRFGGWYDVMSRVVDNLISVKSLVDLWILLLFVVKVPFRTMQTAAKWAAHFKVRYSDVNGLVDTVEDVLELVRSYEISTNSRFVCANQTRNFGNNGMFQIQSNMSVCEFTVCSMAYLWMFVPYKHSRVITVRPVECRSDAVCEFV